ncbi:MAG: zf-HC2 domain-containing protein [Gammaproteobacteria bacterium]|nr:zf-HC2 domain-containing protein [Gammaproteobacteria bacterium]
MLTCKDTSRLISEGQERHLSLKEKISLRMHLWMCNNCRRFEQQIVAMRKIIQGEWANDAAIKNKQLSSEAQERIRQELKENSEQANN